MIQGFRRELEKKTLSELLDCRKPFRCLAKRGTADGETDVFKIVGRQWSRLEPREAIEAGDLAQPVDRHEGFDPSQSRITVGIPDRAIQSFGMQVRIGMVCADQRPAAGEQMEFLDPRVFGCICLGASGGQGLDPGQYLLVALSTISPMAPLAATAMTRPRRWSGV